MPTTHTPAGRAHINQTRLMTSPKRLKLRLDTQCTIFAHQRQTVKLRCCRCALEHTDLAALTDKRGQTRNSRVRVSGVVLTCTVDSLWAMMSTVRPLTSRDTACCTSFSLTRSSALVASVGRGGDQVAGMSVRSGKGVLRIDQWVRPRVEQWSGTSSEGGSGRDGGSSSSSSCGLVVGGGGGSGDMVKVCCKPDGRHNRTLDNLTAAWLTMTQGTTSAFNIHASLACG